MTKKQYTVLKTVKTDGVEIGAGEDVSLEPGQAQALLGTFVEEKAASAPTPKPALPAAAAPPASVKGGKATDGL